MARRRSSRRSPPAGWAARQLRLGNFSASEKDLWNPHGKSKEHAKAVFASGCQKIARADDAESGKGLLIEGLDLGKSKARA